MTNVIDKLLSQTDNMWMASGISMLITFQWMLGKNRLPISHDRYRQATRIQSMLHVVDDQSFRRNYALHTICMFASIKDQMFYFYQS